MVRQRRPRFGRCYVHDRSKGFLSPVFCNTSYFLFNAGGWSPDFIHGRLLKDGRSSSEPRRGPKRKGAYPFAPEEFLNFQSTCAISSKVDILMIEATYGRRTLEPVFQREKQFCNIIKSIVMRGGRCLIPAFALGRAQELLIILG